MKNFKDRILNFYNDDIIKPIIDKMIDDIGDAGAYELILFGNNIYNEKLSLDIGADGLPIGLITKKILNMYDRMKYWDGVSHEPYVSRYRELLYELLVPTSTDIKLKIKYNKFISRCQNLLYDGTIWNNFMLGLNDDPHLYKLVVDIFNNRCVSISIDISNFNISISKIKEIV